MNSLTPLTQHRGRKWLLDRDDLNYFEAILCAEPSLLLDELLEKLHAIWDIEVSMVSRDSLAHTQLSCYHTQMHHKRGSRAERTFLCHLADSYGPKWFLAARLHWQSWHGWPNKFLFGKNSWAPLGQPCICHTSFLHGQKYSILPALSVDGIVALDVVEGPVNQECFLTFLHNHLVHSTCLWNPVAPKSDVFSPGRGDSLRRELSLVAIWQEPSVLGAEPNGKPALVITNLLERAISGIYESSSGSRDDVWAEFETCLRFQFWF